MRHLRRHLAPVCVLVGTAAVPRVAAAQDPFEIEVYPYHTAERGEWELAAHLNYTAAGTTDYDGPVAPTEHQAHLALELTRGITDLWEAGAYLLSAYRPGVGVEYAGWRLRSRRFRRHRRPPAGLAVGTLLRIVRLVLVHPADDHPVRTRRCDAGSVAVACTTGRQLGEVVEGDVPDDFDDELGREFSRGVV